MSEWYEKLIFIIAMRMVITAMTKARMAILNAAADLSLFNLCCNLKMTLLWLVTVFFGRVLADTCREK